MSMSMIGRQDTHIHKNSLSPEHGCHTRLQAGRVRSRHASRRLALQQTRRGGGDFPDLSHGRKFRLRAKIAPTPQALLPGLQAGLSNSGRCCHVDISVGPASGDAPGGCHVHIARWVLPVRLRHVGMDLGGTREQLRGRDSLPLSTLRCLFAWLRISAGWVWMARHSFYFIALGVGFGSSNVAFRMGGGT